MPALLEEAPMLSQRLEAVLPPGMAICTSDFSRAIRYAHPRQSGMDTVIYCIL